MSEWSGCHEFTVTLKSGKVVTAEVECTLVHDSNYGADADGNRGMAMDFIDEIGLTVPIEDPSWEKDDNGVELSFEERQEAEKLILAEVEDYSLGDQAADEAADYFESRMED